MQAPSEHGPQPDEELADRAAIGDQTAFATIYERYFDGVYDFAFRTARDREVAADVVQNAFTNAWESMRKGRGGYNLKAWLYAIAPSTSGDTAAAWSPTTSRRREPRRRSSSRWTRPGLRAPRPFSTTRS